MMARYVYFVIQNLLIKYTKYNRNEIKNKGRLASKLLLLLNTILSLFFTNYFLDELTLLSSPQIICI